MANEVFARAIATIVVLLSIAAIDLMNPDFIYQITTTADISYFTSVSRFYSVGYYREIDATWEESLPALSGTGVDVTRSLSPTGPRSLYRVKVRLP